MRRIVLFGASGQIGSALRRHLETAGDRPPALLFAWNDIASGDGLDLRPGFLDEIATTVGAGSGVDFVFANGITDPAAPPDQVLFSNCDFPSRVFAATLDSAGARFLTLGTVFETVTGHPDTNVYTRSKLRLSERVSELAAGCGDCQRFLHVRLHTIYGGAPKPYMFLGRIAQALETGSQFLMTSGEQLREYHHVDDIAGCLALLLNTEWFFGPIAEINSGCPLRLVDLATVVFRRYGRSDLLRIGALSRPEVDNLDRRFPRSPCWLLPYYRNPVLGVIETLDRVVDRSRLA